MRIIIIGAVASGTSAAAKARRNNEDAEIVLYEKDSYISYSGCGMPYYIGGVVKNPEELTPRDPAFFKSKYNIDIFTLHEVLSVEPDHKTVQVKNLLNGEIFTDYYDKLLFATGACSVLPQIKGMDHKNVFALRNIPDMYKIKSYIEKKNPKTAAVIGSGFIGMEMCENLTRQGIQVTILEKLSAIAPWLDADVSPYVKENLEQNGVKILTKVLIDKIEKENVLLAGNQLIEAELIIIAAGVKPDTALAVKAGVQTGETGAIQVSGKMETNIADIYACGDCAEVYHVVTGRPMFCPLGSTANKTGRIAGDCMTGGNLTFRGILGTGIYQIFDLTVAKTGLSEGQAIAEGYDVAVCHSIKPNKPEYMGGREMLIKAIADKKSGKLLGAQIVGYEGADKRIDVFVTAITYGAKAEDLFHLDLAYAPPFATTKDPVHYTGMILENTIHQNRLLITPNELQALILSGEKYTLIDTRAEKQYEQGHIEQAINIPLAKLRSVMDEIDRDSVVITYCNKGVTGNAAQNVLINNGFQKVFNLSGGYRNYLKNSFKI